MFDREKALEYAQKKLARQQETLQQTLAEIDHIQTVKPNAAALIAMLKTKRDRQAQTIKATEELIEVYSELTADPAQIDIEGTPRRTPRKR